MARGGHLGWSYRPEIRQEIAQHNLLPSLAVASIIGLLANLLARTNGLKSSRKLFLQKTSCRQKLQFCFVTKRSNDQPAACSRVQNTTKKNQRMQAEAVKRQHYSGTWEGHYNST